MTELKPPHPGELIHEAYIEPFKDITGNKIADSLGVAHSTFNRILNGKSNISPEMAVRLSCVLGGTDQSWLNLQANYDLGKARSVVKTNKLSPIHFEPAVA
ncbi:MAG: HigA family addiction module antitoxin [Cycloclasticus sp.]